MCFHGFSVLLICSLKLESLSLTANVIFPRAHVWNLLKDLYFSLFLWACILGPTNSLQWLISVRNPHMHFIHFQMTGQFSFSDQEELHEDATASKTAKHLRWRWHKMTPRGSENGSSWVFFELPCNLSHAQSWTFLEQVVFRSRWLVYMDYHIGI